MARAFGEATVQTPAGRYLTGVPVDLLDPDTGFRIPETVYAESDVGSGLTISLPATTDSSGKLPFWLATGRMVRAQATVNGRLYYDDIPVNDPTGLGFGVGVATGAALGPDVLTTGGAQTKIGALTGTFIDKGSMVFNWLGFGADPTGLTDSWAAIQAANDAAKAAGVGNFKGGISYGPTGDYEISDQLVAEDRVTMRGAHTRSTRIHMGATFPINTALVRIGTGAGVNCFASRVEDMTLLCNAISGSSGVYSTEAQENSGLSRVLVSHYEDCGARFDGTGNVTGAMNFAVEDSEFWSGIGAVNTVGVDLINVRGKCRVNNISVVPAFAGTQLAAVRVAGDSNPALPHNGCAHISNVHTEHHVHGVLWNPGSWGYALGVNGLGVTNVVTISTTDRVVVVAPIGGGQGAGPAVAINDTIAGITIEDTGFYDNQGLGGAAMTVPVVEEFTVSGSSTIPPGCKTVTIIATGGGGGGASGRRGAAGTARGGGGGGHGGASAEASYPVTDVGAIGATLTVTIGAGGAGGVARTANDQNGADGGFGGNTSLANATGTLLLAVGALGGSGGAVAGGLGGQTPVDVSYVGAWGGGVGGDGGSGAAGITAARGLIGGGGGGGGGGISAGDVHFAGAAGSTGGRAFGGFGAGAGGAAGGTAGGSVSSAQAGAPGGSGGGGGGANTGGAAGAGGSGFRGSGGGGGGASLNGANSGAGGVGGSGWLRIVYS